MVILHPLVLEIIQNSYNKYLKNKESRIILYFFLVLFCLTSNAQDSIPVSTSIDEERNVKFQEYFFDAITQKAIQNYQNAINKLADCNELIPNNKAVLFELSKNYLSLNKPFQALQYANEALRLERENLYILEHIVKIHKKDNNFKEAINIQEKIAEKFPKKRGEVVFLYLKNNDVKSAKLILSDLEKAKLLTPKLRRIKNSLFKKNTTENIVVTNSHKNTLLDNFNKNNSFENLKKLLLKLSADNNSNLLEYSKKGIELYPAQPFVYLMNGKGLNIQKQYKKAIDVLLMGIDFVIDDTKTENDFYRELAFSYKNIGDSKNAKIYLKKIK